MSYTPPVRVAALPKKNGNSDFPYHAFVVKMTDGSLRGWGDNTTGNNASTASSGVSTPFNCVFNYYGASSYSTTLPTGVSIVDWCLTASNLYVVTSDGNLWMSGLDGGSQNFAGAATYMLQPASAFFGNFDPNVVGGYKVKNVWAISNGISGGIGNGFSFIYATTNGGLGGAPEANSGQLLAMGLNNTGQLGTGDALTKTSYQVVMNNTLASGGIADIQFANVNGSFASYVLLSSGNLYSTGYNGYNNLGLSSNTTQQTSFQKVNPSGTNNTLFKIAVGSGLQNTTGWITAACISSNGFAYTIGSNLDGACGSFGVSSNPVTSWTQVSNAASNLDNTWGPSGPNVINIGFWDSGLSMWIVSADHSVGFSGYGGDAELFNGSTTASNLYPIAVSTYISGVKINSALPFCVGAANTGNMGSVVPNILFMDQNNRLLMAGSHGVATGSTLNGIVCGSKIIDGVTAVPLPLPIANGLETVVDMWLHGSASKQRIFLLTNHGNLWCMGDNTSSCASGGFASASNPTTVGWTLINLNYYIT